MFMVVYFDDILVNSHDEACYVQHLSQVFQVLKQQMLDAKLKKYKLFTPQVIFLWYIVSREEIQVDEAKVEAIKSWSIPTTVTKV